MDTIKRNKLLQTLSLVLLLGLLWCCSDESVNDIPTTGSEESVVTFSVKVPSAGTPKTTGPKTYVLHIRTSLTLLRFLAVSEHR